MRLKPIIFFNYKVMNDHLYCFCMEDFNIASISFHSSLILSFSLLLSILRRILKKALHFNRECFSLLNLSRVFLIIYCDYLFYIRYQS